MDCPVPCIGSCRRLALWLRFRIASFHRLAFLAAALVLSIATAHAEKIVLSISYSSGAYKHALEKTAEEFERRYPNVQILFRSPIVGTYDELLQQTLRAQVTGDLPDISFQGNQMIKLLAERGLAVPLDPLIATEPRWQDLGYTPSVRAVGEVNGQSYALSYATSVPIIYYNIDLVRRAGGDPDKLPTTWPEIVDLVRRIQSLDRGVVGGYFDYSATGNWTFQALVNADGGQMMAPDDRTIAFDSPAGMRALHVLKEFGAAGTLDMTQDQAIQAFSAGTIGVLASFSAAIDRIEKQAASNFIMRTGVWPIPSLSGMIPAGGRAVVLFTRDPVKQRAAWEFMKFVTGPIGQTILVKEVGAVPNNEIAVKEPELLGKFYDEHPNQRAAFALVPRLTRWYAFPGPNSIKINNAIRDRLREVLIQGRDPTLVLADMVHDVRAFLPE